LVEGTASQGGQGSGAGSQTRAAPTAAPAAAASDTPPDRGHDPEAFPDEDEFWPVVLDGGVLRIRDTSDDLAVKQRLYNLGFGEHAPDKFTDDEFKFAFQQYKHKRNLDSQNDNTVKQALFKEHEISGKPAPPSDDATALGAGSGNRGSGDSTGS